MFKVYQVDGNHEPEWIVHRVEEDLVYWFDSDDTPKELQISLKYLEDGNMQACMGSMAKYKAEYPNDILTFLAEANTPEEVMNIIHADQLIT